MDLQILGHNLEITAKTREHVGKKMGKLYRHLPGIIDAKAELTFDATRSHHDRIVAYVTLHVGKTVLRAHSSAADTKAAVNSVVRALDQQVKRYKSRAYRNARNRLECRQARWRSDLAFRNPDATRKTRSHKGGIGRPVRERVEGQPK